MEQLRIRDPELARLLKDHPILHTVTIPNPIFVRMNLYPRLLHELMGVSLRDHPEKGQECYGYLLRDIRRAPPQIDGMLFHPLNRPGEPRWTDRGGIPEELSEHLFDANTQWSVGYWHSHGNHDVSFSVDDAHLSRLKTRAGAVVALSSPFGLPHLPINDRKILYAWYPVVNAKTEKPIIVLGLSNCPAGDPHFLPDADAVDLVKVPDIILTDSDADSLPNLEALVEELKEKCYLLPRKSGMPMEHLRSVAKPLTSRQLGDIADDIMAKIGRFHLPVVQSAPPTTQPEPTGYYLESTPPSGIDRLVFITKTGTTPVRDHLYLNRDRGLVLIARGKWPNASRVPETVINTLQVSLEAYLSTHRMYFSDEVESRLNNALGDADAELRKFDTSTEIFAAVFRDGDLAYSTIGDIQFYGLAKLGTLEQITPAQQPTGNPTQRPKIASGVLQLKNYDRFLFATPDLLHCASETDIGNALSNWSLAEALRELEVHWHKRFSAVSKEHGVISNLTAVIATPYISRDPLKEELNAKGEALVAAHMQKISAQGKVTEIAQKLEQAQAAHQRELDEVTKVRDGAISAQSALETQLAKHTANLSARVAAAFDPLLKHAARALPPTAYMPESHPGIPPKVAVHYDPDGISLIAAVTPSEKGKAEAGRAAYTAMTTLTALLSSGSTLTPSKIAEDLRAARQSLATDFPSIERFAFGICARDGDQLFLYRDAGIDIARLSRAGALVADEVTGEVQECPAAEYQSVFVTSVPNVHPDEKFGYDAEHLTQALKSDQWDKEIPKLADHALGENPTPVAQSELAYFAVRIEQPEVVHADFAQEREKRIRDLEGKVAEGDEAAANLTIAALADAVDRADELVAYERSLAALRAQLARADTKPLLDCIRVLKLQLTASGDAQRSAEHMYDLARRIAYRMQGRLTVAKAEIAKLARDHAKEARLLGDEQDTLFLHAYQLDEALTAEQRRAKARQLRLGRLRKRYDRLSLRYGVLEDARRVSDDLVREPTQRLEQILPALSDVRKQLEDIAKDGAEHDAKYAEKLTAYCKGVAEYQQRAAELLAAKEEQLAAQRGKLAALRTDLAARADERDAALDELLPALDAMRGEITSLRDTYRALEGQARALQQQNASLTTRLAAAVARNAALEASAAAYEQVRSVFPMLAGGTPTLPSSPQGPAAVYPFPSPNATRASPPPLPVHAEENLATLSRTLEEEMSGYHDPDTVHASLNTYINKVTEQISPEYLPLPLPKEKREELTSELENELLRTNSPGGVRALMGRFGSKVREYLPSLMVLGVDIGILALSLLRTRSLHASQQSVISTGQRSEPEVPAASREPALPPPIPSGAPPPVPYTVASAESSSATASSTPPYQPSVAVATPIESPQTSPAPEAKAAAPLAPAPAVQPPPAEPEREEPQREPAAGEAPASGTTATAAAEVPQPTGEEAQREKSAFSIADITLAVSVEQQRAIRELAMRLESDSNAPSAEYLLKAISQIPEPMTVSVGRMDTETKADGTEFTKAEFAQYVQNLYAENPQRPAHTPVASAETKQKYWKERIQPEGIPAHVGTMVADINEAIAKQQWWRARELLAQMLGFTYSVSGDDVTVRIGRAWRSAEPVAVRALNALGVCYATEGKHREANGALQFAWQLDRNNDLTELLMPNLSSTHSRLTNPRPTYLPPQPVSPELRQKLAYAVRAALPHAHQVPHYSSIKAAA